MTASQRPSLSGLFKAINSLWPSIDEDCFPEEEYRRLANSMISTAAGLHTRYLISKAKTYGVMAEVTKTPVATKESIMAIIRRCCGDGLTIHTEREILNFVVHYWSMLDIELDGSTSLRSAVEARLAQRLASLRVDYPGRLDSELTAASLVRYHDVKIVWTTILEDHLSFDRKKRILKIFEHKIWARNYLRCPERSVVPADVLEEVIRTLNLLFPSFRESTKSLLEEHGRLETIYGLGYCGCKGSQNLADYRYWRAQLEVLQELWTEQPRGLKQFWMPDKEGRNLMVLALFWISGVMVFVLTVVSMVCGAMSVNYAQIQIRQANEAFELSVAQACADPDIGKRLPQYCS